LSTQTRQINVRVSVDDDKLVREFDGSWSEILRLGFEKWCSEYPEFLQKKSQEYQKLYSNCIAKLGKCYNNAIQKNSFLDELYIEYVATGRDANNPTLQDKSWVKARLGKVHNGNRVSVVQAFDYFQKRFNQDKQKKLEVEE
jgi:hypothetical protein